MLTVAHDPPGSSEEAERVTGRVEADTNFLLGLEVRQRRAAGKGPGGGGLEIVDEDVEVLGDVLLARFAGPDRCLPLPLELDVEGDGAVVARRPELRPSRVGGFPRGRRVARRHLGAEQAGVELRELAGLRCADRDRGELEPWCVHDDPFPLPNLDAIRGWPALYATLRHVRKKRTSRA
jgi:hypothetical protein